MAGAPEEPVEQEGLIALAKGMTMCGWHRSHPLTEVKDGAVSWSYCGLCEADRVRLFVNGVRDPELKRRFEAALTGGR